MSTQTVNDNTKWKLKFIIWPVKSSVSGKILWLTYGYKNTYSYYILSDMGMSKDLWTITSWVSKSEFIVGKLSGTL